MEDLAFTQIGHPQKWFKTGRVFAVRSSETALAGVDIYVVIKENASTAVCVPLEYQTEEPHSGDYAAVHLHSKDRKSSDGSFALPGFDMIIENQVFANIENSRYLNLAQPQTISHGSQVVNVGRIDRKSLKELRTSFTRVMDDRGACQIISSSPNLTPANISMDHNQDFEPIWADSDCKSLYPLGNTLPLAYKVHFSKFFKIGMVFKTIWSEPTTSPRGPPSAYHFEDSGKGTYVSIRRFVVIESLDGAGSSTAIPIYTYGRRATSKPGVKGAYHAIIHSSEESPEEILGEEKLSLESIKVDVVSREHHLHPRSRLNYSKPSSIEHNQKILIIGRVARSHIHVLLETYHRIHMRNHLMEEAVKNQDALNLAQRELPARYVQ